MPDIDARFEVKTWDEQPFDEDTDGARLTRALVVREYTGDISGSSTTEWLMAYEPDETAAFVGLERIAGEVAGRRGTLVVQHVGRFADGAAKATVTIISGTDGLDGARGSGNLVADPQGRVSLNVELQDLV